MWFIQFVAIIAAFVASALALVNIDTILKKLYKVLGFGFLVYHSDSAKTFYATTRKDALEWMSSTYADAVLMSAFTGETLAIKFGAK